MSTNQKLFNESKNVLVGGVNSPVRAMKPDYPFFVERGEKCYLFDKEGKRYIDYCCAYGPLIFGHARKEVIKALHAQLDKGTIYGTPTELELKFAKEVTAVVPNVDMIRCLNTGTEATMTAIRLARGFTGRNKVIKISGAYHGAHDSVLVKTGSGALTHAVPNSAGIPAEVTKHTLLCDFNDTAGLNDLFSNYKEEIACIIIEPVMGNVGCILPENGYLKDVRRICSENGSLLIFDEVITGFRLGLGGAQEHFGVNADLVTMGKIIGGGLPIGIFGGRREIMEKITPEGNVYNAGTFNGNPLSITAGYTVLQLLKDKKPYSSLQQAGNELRKGLQDIFPNTSVQGIVSMYCMYISDSKVTNYQEALDKVDKDRFLEYQRYMLKSGVFHPPSQYECNFISTAHGSEVINETLEKAKQWNI